MSYVTILHKITWCSKWTTVTFKGTKECFSPICQNNIVFFFKHVLSMYFLRENTLEINPIRLMSFWYISVTEQENIKAMSNIFFLTPDLPVVMMKKLFLYHSHGRKSRVSTRVFSWGSRVLTNVFGRVLTKSFSQGSRVSTSFVFN